MKRGILVLSLLVVSCLVGAKPEPRKLAWLTEHPVIQKLHKLQNEERARNGLKPLVLNPEMCKVSQDHAVWMCSTGAFQHSNCGLRENIYFGILSPEAAISGWTASPGHRANLLSNSSESGFGYYVGPSGTRWVATFR